MRAEELSEVRLIEPVKKGNKQHSNCQPNSIQNYSLGLHGRVCCRAVLVRASAAAVPGGVGREVVPVAQGERGGAAAKVHRLVQGAKMR